MNWPPLFLVTFTIKLTNYFPWGWVKKSLFSPVNTLTKHVL